MTNGGWTLSLIGAIVLVVAAHSPSWRIGRPDETRLIRAGLNTVETCGATTCVRMTWAEATAESSFRPGPLYVVSSILTYYLSLAAAAVLVLAAFVRRRMHLARLATLAATLCGCTVMVALATTMTVSGGLAAGTVVGWGFALGLAGGTLGLLGAAYLLIPDEGVVTPELERWAHQQRPKPALLDAPRNLELSPLAKPRGGRLAYEIRSLEVADDELLVDLGVRSGLTTVPLSSLVEAAVWQLPHDHHGGALFLDLIVESASARWPIRLTCSTRVNYHALPDGPLLTSQDNFRAILRWLEGLGLDLELSPAARGFAQGGPAPRMAGVGELIAHDAQFIRRVAS